MNKYTYIFILGLILHLVFVINAIGQPYHGDEIVFLEASKGVLTSGKPVFNYSLLNPDFQGLWHPPLYIYLMSLAIFLFGKALYVVRGVSAMFNFLTIILVYFTTKEILKENKEKEFWAVFAGLLYALNPLVIQSSVPLDIDAGILNFSIYLFLYFYIKEKNYLYLIPSLFLVFWSKENGVVTLFLSLFLTSLISLNWKETRKIIGLFFISGLLFVLSFYVYAQKFNLNFLMPFKTNYPIFSDTQSNLIHLSLVQWAKSVWAFNNFFYFVIPFLVILFLIASLEFYLKNFKNLKNQKVLIFNVLSWVTIGLFFYLAANSWGFPKYYITAVPGMCIFLAYWFSKKDEKYFKLNYKKLIIFVILTLILTLYFVYFLKDPLYPKLDSTTSNTSIGYALKMMIETVLLYIIIPFVIVFLSLFIFRFKKKVIYSLIYLVFFCMIYINLLHSQVDYSTYYNYGDRGVLEVIDYINANNISSNNIAAYPHVGSYLGIENYYDINFLYLNASLFKEKVVDNPEIKYIIIYKKDLDRIGENMNYFKLEKQIASYYIYKKI